MSPDRWQQVERLYFEALEREFPQRTAFLAEACSGDDALRREVESLLAQESYSTKAGGPVNNPLDRPAWEGAGAEVGGKGRDSLYAGDIVVCGVGSGT